MNKDGLLTLTEIDAVWSCCCRSFWPKRCLQSCQSGSTHTAAKKKLIFFSVDPRRKEKRRRRQHTACSFHHVACEQFAAPALPFNWSSKSFGTFGTPTKVCSWADYFWDFFLSLSIGLILIAMATTTSCLRCSESGLSPWRTFFISHLLSHRSFLQSQHCLTTVGLYPLGEQRFDVMGSTSAAPWLDCYLRKKPHNPATASHNNQLKWYLSNQNQYVSKQHHFSSMQIISEQQNREKWFPFKCVSSLRGSPSVITNCHCLC